MEGHDISSSVSDSISLLLLEEVVSVETAKVVISLQLLFPRLTSSVFVVVVTNDTLLSQALKAAI